MKIAFVYDAVYPETKGGVEKRVWELARRFAGRGHEVHLLVPHAWDGPPSIERDGVILRACPLVETSTRGKDDGRCSRTGPCARRLQAFTSRAFRSGGLPDPRSPCCSTTRRCLLDQLEVRQVITWHEVWENSWMDEMGLLLGHFGRVVERSVTRIPAIHVTVSEHNAASLSRLGRETETVIHPGVHVIEPDFSEVPESDILFVGRLVPTKNVGLSWRATATLTASGLRPRVLIVGRRAKPGRMGTSRRGSRTQRPGHVHGSHKRRGAAHGHHQFGACSALPSVREGFGMIALEAAAHGVPVVTVDHERNAARHVVSHGVTGLSVPPDPADFADALQSILGDEDNRLRLSRGAFESARYATWDRAVDRTEAAYRMRVADQQVRERPRSLAGEEHCRPARLGSTHGTVTRHRGRMYRGSRSWAIATISTPQ